MDLSLFLEGGWVSRKDHLVTLLRCHYWLGGVGVQGKSDNVTLYHVFFLTASLMEIQKITLYHLQLKTPSCVLHLY